jgi:peptidoglycan/LPS O-acetylase OafA/YrhL
MSSSITLESPDDPRVDPEDPKTGYAATPLHARYLGGLDGLRAFALMAILIGHLAYSSSIRTFWIRGDWLGVSTFFVLSGFLITRGLIHEHDHTGTTSLSRFWMRRAKRLLPALYAALLFLMLISVFKLTPMDKQLPTQFITTLFYVRNWYYLSFHGINGPVMFQYWSLSIEEQFYLVAPLVFLLSLKWLGRKKAVFVFIALGLASYIRAYYVSRSGNWNGVYFSTPTRVGEILAGVVLAFVMTTHAVRRLEGRRWWTPLAQVTGAIGLVSIIVLWHITGVEWTTFHRSVPVNVIATCLVIVACTTAGPLSSFLAISPLRWLGRISYGAYLYHLGLYFIITGERFHIHNDTVLAFVRIGATLLVADISYRFLEQPLRRRTTPTGKRFVVAYSLPAIGLIILALTLPFPTVKHAKPVSLGTFASGDALAASSAPRVAVVGDELAQASLPALHQLTDADPTRLWVSVHTAARCPIAGPVPLALDGKVVLPDHDCRWVWFTLPSMLPYEKPDTLVMLMGIADLADRELPNHTWGHLGQPAANLQEQAALESLAKLFKQRHIKQVVWYLPPPDAAVKTYQAYSQGVSADTTGAAAKAGPPPPAPTTAELRQRAAALAAIMHEVSARYPNIQVLPLPSDPSAVLQPFASSGPTGPPVLGTETWRQLLHVP